MKIVRAVAVTAENARRRQSTLYPLFASEPWLARESDRMVGPRTLGGDTELSIPWFSDFSERECRLAARVDSRKSSSFDRKLSFYTPFEIVGEIDARWGIVVDDRALGTSCGTGRSYAL